MCDARSAHFLQSNLIGLKHEHSQILDGGAPSVQSGVSAWPCELLFSCVTEQFANPLPHGLLSLVRMNSRAQFWNRFTQPLVKLAGCFATKQGCPEHQPQFWRLILRGHSTWAGLTGGHAVRFGLTGKPGTDLAWPWRKSQVRGPGADKRSLGSRNTIVPDPAPHGPVCRLLTTGDDAGRGEVCGGTPHFCHRIQRLFGLRQINECLHPSAREKCRRQLVANWVKGGNTSF